jgi:hypothetical protein
MQRTLLQLGCIGRLALGKPGVVLHGVGIRVAAV